MADKIATPPSAEPAPTGPTPSERVAEGASRNKDASQVLREAIAAQEAEERGRANQQRKQEVAKELVEAQGNPPNARKGLEAMATMPTPDGEVIHPTQAVATAPNPTSNDFGDAIPAEKALIDNQQRGSGESNSETNDTLPFAPESVVITLATALGQKNFDTAVSQLSDSDLVATEAYLREQIAGKAKSTDSAGLAAVQNLLSNIEIAKTNRAEALKRAQEIDQREETFFNTDEDIRRKEQGESTTTEDFNLFINNADAKKLKELASYLQEQLRLFQEDPTGYTSEQIAQMLRAQKLVNDKLQTNAPVTPEASVIPALSASPASEAAVAAPAESVAPSATVAPEATVEAEKKPIQFTEQVTQVIEEIKRLESIPDLSSADTRAVINFGEVMSDSLFMADVTSQMLEEERIWNLVERAKAVKEQREVKPFDRKAALKRIATNAYHEKREELQNREQDKLRKVIKSRGEKLQKVKERLAKLGDKSNPNIEEQVDSEQFITEITEDIRKEIRGLNREKERLWIILFLFLVLGVTKDSFTEGQKAVVPGR